MRCDMTRHQSNTHCNVRALTRNVKCDCSVQRIETNTNNLAISKHATICCYTWCIFRETGTYFFVSGPQRWECYIEPDGY